ncbi:MAG: hypothetical protein GY730_11420 [bacterium]|nr:hypothetical protein [bacterium]
MFSAPSYLMYAAGITAVSYICYSRGCCSKENEITEETKKTSQSTNAASNDQSLVIDKKSKTRPSNLNPAHENTYNKLSKTISNQSVFKNKNLTKPQKNSLKKNLNIKHDSQEMIIPEYFIKIQNDNSYYIPVFKRNKKTLAGCIKLEKEPVFSNSNNKDIWFNYFKRSKPKYINFFIKQTTEIPKQKSTLYVNKNGNYTTPQNTFSINHLKPAAITQENISAQKKKYTHYSRTVQNNKIKQKNKTSKKIKTKSPASIKKSDLPAIFSQVESSKDHQEIKDIINKHSRNSRNHYSNKNNNSSHQLNKICLGRSYYIRYPKGFVILSPDTSNHTGEDKYKLHFIDNKNNIYLGTAGLYPRTNIFCLYERTVDKSNNHYKNTLFKNCLKEKGGSKIIYFFNETDKNAALNHETQQFEIKKDSASKTNKSKDKFKVNYI